MQIETLKFLKNLSKNPEIFVKYLQFSKYLLEKCIFRAKTFDIFENWIHFLIH